MRSKQRYELLVSERVDRLLRDLHRTEPRRCRELALLLLCLEKEPRPPGSRELRPGGNPAPGERIWQHAEFTILYRVDDKTDVIEIGVVKWRR